MKSFLALALPVMFAISAEFAGAQTAPVPAGCQLGVDPTSLPASGQPSPAVSVRCNGTGPFLGSWFLDGKVVVDKRFMTSGSAVAFIPIPPNTASSPQVHVATVTVCDVNNANCDTTPAVNITVAAAAPPPLVFSPSNLPNGTVNVHYDQTLSASGGSPPYTFALGSGALPAGLTLNPGGAISGTPTAPGTSSCVILVKDSAGDSAAQNFSITVTAPPLTLSPAVLPDASIGVPYRQAISASGGVPPYTFALSSGTLPGGLTLNPQTGVISGTPTAPSASSFVMAVGDSNQGTASQSYSLVVTAPLTLSPATLPNATVGVPYSQTIAASGGTPPHTFLVTAGTLPGGFALNGQTGVLSGTTSAPGTFVFTITATDSKGATSSRSYTLGSSAPAGTAIPVSGDKQVAAAGAPLPANLVAKIVNTSGNPVSGVPVTWSVTHGGGTLTNPSAISDAQGLVQSGYITGPLAEENTIQVRVTSNGFTVTFTVRNQHQVVTIPAKQLIAPQERMALDTPAIQISNVRQRQDQLRLQRSPTAAEALRVAIDGKTMRSLTVLGLAPADKDGKPQAGGAAIAETLDPFERWGAFVNGDVDIATQSAVDTQTGFKLRSKGVTLGADYRFDGNHVLGAAVGLLRADSDLDDGLGNQNAKGYSVSLYGSYVPQENAYIDGILNLGHNKYDTRRLQTTAAGVATSNTSGNQLGVAVSIGYAFNRGPLALTPYGRVEYIDAMVKAFTESGSTDEALTIGEQHMRATTVLAGGQASHAFSTSWGVLIPNAHVEFHHVVQTSARNVTAQLAADIASQAEIAVSGPDRNFGIWGVGVSGQFAYGVSAFFSYEAPFGKDNVHDQRYTLGLSVAF